MDLACLFLAPKLEKQDRKCVGGANSVSYRRHANLLDETAIDEEEKEKRFFRLMPNRNSVSHPILYTFFFYLSRKQHFLFVCLFVLGGCNCKFQASRTVFLVYDSSLRWMTRFSFLVP